MSRRLKPSDVGYHGKGIPDPITMAQLQGRYAANMISSGTLPPEIKAKLAEMERLTAIGDEAARKKAAFLAAELMPHLNFKVDEVDWEH